MEQRYIYRVLRENEIVDKGLGKGLYSKAFDMNYCGQKYSFGEALDNITTHIMNGNRRKTEFISCSKDFCLDLEKYGAEQLDLRPFLAFVENHSESVVESSKFKILFDLVELTQKYETLIYINERYDLIEEFENIIKNHPILNLCYPKMMNSQELFRWRIPKQICLNTIRELSQLDIKKMVIDASENIYSDKMYQFFMSNKLICNKNGFVKERINQWEYGTAKNSSEVLVLNHIEDNDFRVLNPLQYDILYSLINNYSIYAWHITPEVIDYLEIFSNEYFQKIENMFNDKEKTLFRRMYVGREPIYKIISELSELKSVIDCKRQIIAKCIRFMDLYYEKKYRYEYILTLEESINFYDSPVVEVKDGKIFQKVKMYKN